MNAVMACFSSGSGHLVFIGAHGIHEQTLACGEQHRQCVEEMGDVLTGFVPVVDAGLVEVDFDVTAHWNDFHGVLLWLQLFLYFGTNDYIDQCINHFRH